MTGPTPKIMMYSPVPCSLTAVPLFSVCSVFKGSGNFLCQLPNTPANAVFYPSHDGWLGNQEEKPKGPEYVIVHVQALKTSVIV